MEICASSLVVPRWRSSEATLSSCNSIFFNNGGRDLIKISSSSVSVVNRSRRAQKGLDCRCLFGLGVPELAVIGGVALLLFGPKRLPDVGRSIGKTVKSFQQAAKEFESEIKKPDASSPAESPKETAVKGGEKSEL